MVEFIGSYNEFSGYAAS